MSLHSTSARAFGPPTLRSFRPPTSSTTPTPSLEFRPPRQLPRPSPMFRSVHSNSTLNRSALAEVECNLLAARVHSDVPFVVKVDDVLEALEDAVVHVSLHEIWRWPFVRSAQTGRLEWAAGLGDVARDTLS